MSTAPLTNDTGTASMTLVRKIRARPEIVFDALIRPEQIMQWWGPDSGPVLFAETDPRPGGQWRVRFRMENGDEEESFGTYLEFARPRSIVMSWRWLSTIDWESRVEISLRPIDIGTELTFTHARLRNEEVAAGHERGWSGSLAKLVALFEAAEEKTDD